MSNEKYIVTSALPYINGVKHIGNLIGSLLPADVFARYLRLRGRDVVAICGTDDHGTPAEIAALEAGLSVEDYCTKMYKVQKKNYEDFNLSFDYFGRTSDIENHEITQSLFLKLYENGYIFEKEDEQLFSVDDDRFLPDRYVIGTCPHCGYERARGDQCEDCSTLLNPTQLINPKSVISDSNNLVIKQTKHLYIDLPKIQPKVEEWVNKQEQWPLTTLSIAQKWLREGLRPRSITRNLKWGIPVPLQGYEDLVFYVWFDAPIGYISMTKKWAKLEGDENLWLEYWKNPKTRYYEFMGIDNVPFHTVTFPSTIIGADDGYILPTFVKGFQWLTYPGGKFSTSQKRGVFIDQALELYPADYWRYYLLLIAPERQNTEFNWKLFQDAVNNDLNNQFGNLVNRTVTFIERNFDGKVPTVDSYKKEDEELWQDLEHTVKEYEETFEQVEFQKPLKALKTFVARVNKYFTETKPWEVIKTDKKRAGEILSNLAHVLRSIALLSHPFIPSSAEKIYLSLGIAHPITDDKWERIIDRTAIRGNTVKFQGHLFKKITDKEVKKYEIEFGAVVVSDEESKQPEKPKKSKKPTKESKFITIEDFDKVKIKSAKVLDCVKHPKSDKLLVLTVDDGERKDRTIVAGIAKYYNPEDLKNRTVMIVDNLKPRKLGGIKSEGMVLAVEDEKGVSLLSPDRDFAGGFRAS